MDELAPTSIAPPFGAYSHGILAPVNHRLLVTSGQLGLSPSGDVPGTVAEQTEVCFENIRAILAEAGAGPSAIVRLNAYVTAREHFPEYMAVRDRFLDGVSPRPASTLLIVSGFTRAEFLVEVEATAVVPA